MIDGPAARGWAVQSAWRAMENVFGKIVCSREPARGPANRGECAPRREQARGYNAVRERFSKHALSRWSRAAGFTLIELLVVVAIIALLAALLLPALRGARDRAKQVVCLNNLAQIGLAIQMYADDNNGWYPPSWDHRAGNPNYRWSHRRFVGNYIGGNRGVLRCPSDERPALVNPTEFDYQFSYGQIVYGGGIQIGTLSGNTYYDGYAPRQLGGVVTVHQVNTATGQPTGGGVFSWDPIASPTTIVNKQYTPYMFEAENVVTHVFSLTRVRHGARKTVMNYLGFDLRPRRIDLRGSNWGFHLQAGPEDPIPTWHTVNWYRADMGNYYSAPHPDWPFQD